MGYIVYLKNGTDARVLTMGTYLMFMHTAEHVQECSVVGRVSLYSHQMFVIIFEAREARHNYDPNVNYHVQMLIALVRNYGSLKNE